MEDKITIIEGPPPTFELVDEGWSLGVLEGPTLYNVAVTQLRTFNGGQLVERCYHAWKRRENIQLEYRSEDGSQKEAVIVAAQTAEADKGEVLVLWVRLPDEEIELALDFDDDPDDDGDNFGPLA
jgi:hypothetical protein